MKKRVWVMALITAAVLSGCGGKQAQEAPIETTVQETAAEQTEKKEEQTKAAEEASSESSEGAFSSKATEDFRAHFNEITINGKVMTLPAAYSELEANGMKLLFTDGNDAPKNIPLPGYVSMGENGEASFALDFGFKGEEESRPVEECDIIGFVWGSDSCGNENVRFYGGIGKDSTQEEVSALLDEDFDDGTSARYCTSLDEKEQSSLEVLFYEGQIKKIAVKNYAGYVE